MPEHDRPGFLANTFDKSFQDLGKSLDEATNLVNTLKQQNRLTDQDVQNLTGMLRNLGWDALRVFKGCQHVQCHIDQPIVHP